MPCPLLLGLEIGGSKLQVGIGHGDGTILDLERAHVDPAAGAQGIQAQIVALIEGIRRRHPTATFPVLGVGFGGPVDSARGQILRSHQIEGWDGFALAAWLSSACRVPVVRVENDSDTAAFAEAKFGAGKGASPMLYVNSGSGVGGGLIVDGQIYRGTGVGALEIGHLVIETETQPPISLQDMASGWAIARAGTAALASHSLEASTLRALAERNASRVTGQIVGEAALLGDPVALQVCDRATDAMARALAHAVTLLAPRRVALGGGVSQLPALLWIEPIRRGVEKYVYPGFRGTFDIVPAALGEAVVVHGALGVAREAWQALASG